MQRLCDIFFSILSIILLSPVFLLLALFIKIESRGPILFLQTRVGRNKQPFTIYKFRSMRVNTIAPLELGRIKHDHAIVTRVGHFMRRTKLDEIPQFFNVLFGDMAIVGPRPCLFETMNTMSASECRRFDVMPGVTGWAEVNGNVELSWEEQLVLDLWYVDHRSALLDLHIIIQTILTVFVGSIKNKKALLKARLHRAGNE